MGSRTPIRYSIATLLAIVTICAVIVHWCHYYTTGTICLKSDADSWHNSGISFVDSSFLPFVEVCRDQSEAELLLEAFDRKSCEQRFQQLIQQSPIKTMTPLPTTNYSLFRAENAVGVKYDCDEWGRYKLDLNKVKFVFDTSDPVAAERNAILHESNVKAIREQLSIGRSKLQNANSTN